MQLAHERHRVKAPKKCRDSGKIRGLAAFARAEARPIAPHLLTRALGGVEEVVEFPCGTGHFLTAYAQAGVWDGPRWWARRRSREGPQGAVAPP